MIHQHFVPNFWDYVRIVKAFTDIYIFALSSQVVYKYFVAARVAKVKSKMAAKLPNHVWTIALSYLLFIVGGSFGDTFTRWGEGGSARIFIYLVASLLGVYALHTLRSYEGKKYTKETSFIYRPDFDAPMRRSTDKPQ